MKKKKTPLRYRKILLAILIIVSVASALIYISYKPIGKFFLDNFMFKRKLFDQRMEKPPEFSLTVNCDEVSGSYKQDDIYLSRKDKCYRDQAVASKNPDLCKKLPGEYAIDLCLFHVAKTSDVWQFCTDISDHRYKNMCLAEFAKKLADSNIEAALKICGTQITKCSYEAIRIYQESKQMTNKEVAYTCLKYIPEDEIQLILCKKNLAFLQSRNAHQELLYIYGYNYPKQGKKFCDNIKNYFITSGDGAGNTDYCYQQVAKFTEEMNHIGSDFYKFLRIHPQGFGEPW